MGAEEQSEHREVGAESLRYHPSKVSWAMSQHISRENPKIHRILVYFITSIFIVSILFSLFTKVAISIKASGNLDFEDNSLSLVNNNDLVVNKIFFKDNEPIKKNDLLLIGKKQITEMIEKKLRSDAQEVLTQIDTEKNGGCSINCIKILENIIENGFIKNEGLNVESTLVDYLRQLSSDLNAYIVSLKNVGSEDSTLSGLRLRLSQAQSKLNLIFKKNVQSLLAMEVENLKKEIADIKSQIEEKKLGNFNQVSNARSALVLSLKPLNEKIIDYKKNHEIRSPVDGIIKYEGVGGEGELLSARTKVFQIIPASSHLVAKIYVQNKDISLISKNQKVKIAIQALPEREFGAVEGVITKISTKAIESKESQNLNYQVFVQLDRQSLVTFNGEEKKFKSGMLLDAKIITKHRTLFWVGMSKLLNLKEEYLGELF